MTRNIGRMDTPPQGIPMHPNVENTPAAGSEVNLHLPDVNIPKSAEDIFVLGHYFAEPRGFIYKYLADHFHLKSNKHYNVEGDLALNDLFLVDFRTVAGRGVHLHEFHSAVGHLGASFEFLDNALYLKRHFDVWHDLILKSFFLEMLSSSYPTAGETLARLWTHDINYFGKADSQLRSLSTYPQTNDYSRAAALRVYGYATPFLAHCYPSITSNTIKHLSSFQTHQNPLVATAATFSLRKLGGIIR